MLSDILEYARGDEQLLYALGSLSVLTFVGSLVLVPILVARVPADYFLEERLPPESWRGRHPLLRFAVRVLKNTIGLSLVLAGVTMLVLPGQGLLTILVGLTLVDFPGKRRLELWLVTRKQIGRAIAWIRRRSGRPPLELPTTVRPHRASV